MKNPGLPNMLWEALDQRLWHATGLDGLHGIVTSGEIAIAGARYKNNDRLPTATNFCVALLLVARN